MIPLFPEFKKVGVNDREAVESHAHRYPPYSDFNFTSLWAWDTSNERMISELNGNLVVRFTDYSSHEHFFSFLGTNEPEHTARELIRHAESLSISPTLQLVPEVSVTGMRASVLAVGEDKDHFDYLYSTEELATLKGIRFKGKRQMLTRFMHAYPEAYVEIGDLNNVNIQKQIISILRTWESNKKSENKEYELQHEETAITRLFQTADKHTLVVTGIFLKGSMIAFSIDEILPKQYSITHFAKADSSNRGIYDFLNSKVALHLAQNDTALWNWEQDLGVESLRRSKLSYRPTRFLKKYRVSLAKSDGENAL